MPNIFSKIFRRKNAESDKDSLVEQHTSGGRNGGKKKNNNNSSRNKSSPRRSRKGPGSTGPAASAASSTTTEVAANTSKLKTSPVKGSPLSPQSATSPTSGRTTTSTSILHQSNGRTTTRPGYEFAPSTGSTSKTSDQDSPPPSEDAGDTRSSPPKVNGWNSTVSTHRVLSPRNSAASPPSRSSTGPVDLDDENSDDDENMMRRHVSAIPVFAMEGTSPTAPHLLLNKPPVEATDDGSSLNFSTDADEDTEYLKMKQGAAPPHSSLDQSVSSAYKSEADSSVFPNLIEENEPKSEEKPSLPSAWDPNSPILEDFPTSSSGNVSGFPSPPPQPPSALQLFKQSKATQRQKQSVTSTTSASTVSPQPFPDDFAFEADFSNFQTDWPNDSDAGAPSQNTHESPADGETAPAPKKHSMVYIETGKLRSSSRARGEHVTTLSGGASRSTRETSLEELLEKARSKAPPNRKSASSVNSAPVVKSSSLARDGGSVTRRLESRSTADGGGAAASVSDIIKNLSSANKTRDSGSVKSAKERLKKLRQQKESDESDEAAESWYFDQVTRAIGPQGIAADLESLSGRSHLSGGGRSHKSHRSTKSKRRSRRSSGESVNSKDSKRSNTSRRSRSSRYSHRSTKSYISQMSEQSRSVANDLLRLEMQLAMVGQQQSQQNTSNASATDEPSKSSVGPEGGHRSSRSRASSASGRRTSSAAAARRSRITVMAPPGKLGIILANKADSKGTVVSGVRTSSVLAEKISPGDRIVAIDGEDVSLMTVSEITTIMARKADFERTLTVLTTPRTTSNMATASHGEGSHQEGKKYRP